MTRPRASTRSARSGSPRGSRSPGAPRSPRRSAACQAPGRRRRPRALPPPLRLLGRPLRGAPAGHEPLGKRRARPRRARSRQGARRAGGAGRRPRRRQLDARWSRPRSSSAPTADRIRHVFWHVDLDGFAPERADPNLRASLGWPEDALVVLSLRNFRPDTQHRRARRGVRPRRRGGAARAAGPRSADTGPLRRELEPLVDTARARGPRRVPPRRREGSPAAGRIRRRRGLHRQLRLDAAVLARGDGLAAAPSSARPRPSIDEWVGAGEGAEIVPVRDEPAAAAASSACCRTSRSARATASATCASCASAVGDPGPELDRLYRELVAA